MTESIRVLHVDDEPDFADLTAQFLEREDERIDVVTETSASDGLDRLADEAIDCIVSDYQMPGMDGLEFLEVVREEYPDLPFLLFTGRGSEEVASEAITAGATDYLQKGSGTERYELLANRFLNAVDQYRSKRRAAELNRMRTLVNDINQALVRADSRDVIETRVCEIISDFDPYLFAWIGDVDPETNRIEPRVSAGVEDGYLDEITVTADESPTGQGPGGTAIRERRVVVSQDIADDPEFEPWREGALERGYRAVAAVPLEYEETLYGELVVYAGRPHAFDEDEQELLVELGDDIAHAVVSIDIRDDLRSEKERFRLLAESATDAIVTIDTESTIQFASSAIEDIFGYPRDELVGEPLTMLMPDQYRTRHREAVTQFLETGERRLDWSDVELPGLRKDGQEVDLSIAFAVFEQGGDRYFEGIIRDISERKKRERELERYETITETVQEGICVLNQDSEFMMLNDAFVELTNYSRDDLLGSHASLVRPEELNETFDEMQDSLESGSNTESIEMEITRADGTTRMVEARYAPFSDRDDVGRVGVWRDITEQEIREQELTRQNERLEEFASVVSHDLRNPLNVAQGRLELAREQCDSGHLDSAANGVDRSLALVDDLLTLAREGEQASEVEPVDLWEMCDGCWQTVETADAGLVSEADRTIQADPGRLKQLLENLMRNAIEHGGEEVTVTIGDLDDGFYIADDGPGIPEDERDQVFDAGYSTAEEGTGFGLNIVTEIVEAHDWEISVGDSEDGGARFEITDVIVGDE